MGKNKKNTQKSEIVVDYYRVEIPSDVVQDNDRDEWEYKMGEVAIADADRRTRLYVMPATWEAKLISGGPDTFNSKFQVKRYRRRPAKRVVSDVK